MNLRLLSLFMVVFTAFAANPAQAEVPAQRWQDLKINLSEGPTALSPLLRVFSKGKVENLTVLIGLRAESWALHVKSASWRVLDIKRPNHWVVDLNLQEGRDSSATLAVALKVELNPSQGRVVVQSSEISCQALLSLVPKAWIEPFGKLRLEGTIAPQVEVQRSLGKRVQLRIDGVDTAEHHCRVTELEWQSQDVDWLNTAFIKPIISDYLPTGVDREVGPGSPDFVPISELPAYVGAAMIYSEEHEFYAHQGVSTALVARAIMRNLDEDRITSGGSTITQQLVKNLFLSRDRTLERKFQEAILATRVWQKVSKERVLELYLNCIEFGPGVWGIGQAARYYFGKDARDLTVSEVTFLAAIKPQPMLGEKVRLGQIDLEKSGLKATVRAITRTMERHGFR